MSDVLLGKQMFEVDWDTDEVTNLEPYIRRLLERNNELLERMRGNKTWIEYETVNTRMRAVPISGSGSLDDATANLITQSGQMVRRVECQVVRKPMT